MSDKDGDHTPINNEQDYDEAVTADQGLWEKFKTRLREYLSDDAFNRWFDSAKLLESDGKTGVIGVRSDMHQIWIETNYMDELRATFAEVVGNACQPKVVVLKEDQLPKVEVLVETGDVQMQVANRDKSTDEAKETEVVKVVKADDRTVAMAKKDTPTLFDKKIKRMGMNPELNFSTFVVGENSQFAHAACQAIAEGRARGYNPLFLHGGSGFGKTHLMTALGQQILSENPKAKVVYSTAENFTNEFINTLRSGDLDSFRKKYRTVDLMLLDDVQFLSGKEKSQEEFFHTFNALMNTNTQIVLSCDRPAQEIQTFEPRLLSRFENGLTVEVKSPGFETRVAILRRKMEQWDVELDDAVVFHIANLIRSNVRRLEGALTRIASYSFLSSDAVTLEKTQELLSDLVIDEESKQINVDTIQRTVSDFYDIRLADMQSRKRPARIAFPRQVAMYLTRELTNMSLVEIGESFGRRDHGTVIHACKKVKADMAKQRDVSAAVAKLTSILKH